MAWVDPRCNDIVAHLDEVTRAVSNAANERAQVARGVLAAHRKTGASHIDVSHGDVDSFINLHDPLDALAVEFGRRGTRGHGTSRGVHALGAAMGG